jgi:hypothetical protein
MKPSVVRSFTLLSLFALAACGDDNPAAVDASLSRVEAEELAGVVLSTVFSAASGVDTSEPAMAPAGPALASFSYTRSFEDVVVPCPSGGEVTLDVYLDISGDDTTGAERIEYSMTHAHSGCMATSEEGHVFTLTGDPNVVVEVVAEASAGSTTTIDGTIVGGLLWELEGRTGSCVIDLEFGGTAGETSVAFGMMGTVCGISVEESITVTG